MLLITQADLIKAAIVSNFLYGALLMAMAPSRIALDAGSALWVAATGAVGHLFHVTMLPAGDEPGEASPMLVAFDIVLVFASLLVFVLTFPRFAHLVVDSVGGWIG